MTKRSLAAMFVSLLMGLALALWFSSFHSVGANPRILYAAPTVQGSGNCSSWANACTLQTALTQAQSGDEIWVKAGVHYPGSAGQCDATFTLKNGLALYGGFAGTETSREQRDWQSKVTVLSGDIDHNDITDPNAVVTATANIRGNNAYHVVTVSSGTDTLAILDGFVVTAGWARYGDGGGMYNNNWPSNFALTNVVFSGNYASRCGGGMYNYSNPTLMNVTFSGNSASSGGGMCNEGSTSNPTLTNVTFYSNTTVGTNGEGGGMFNWCSSPRLVNVTFSSNSAPLGGSGGGMSNWYGRPTLVNVTFSGNWATAGGGMNNRGSSPTLINTTFSSNSAQWGGGVYNGGISSSPSRLTVVNSILWGNSAPGGPEIYNETSSTITVTYSIVRGGWPGEGNLDANPFFVDAANGNLRLRSDSPAIDAGDNTAIPSGITTDLDGNPRVSGAAVDMGAYEFQWPATPTPTPTFTPTPTPTPTSTPTPTPTRTPTPTPTPGPMDKFIYLPLVLRYH